eukprot:symbB.v1.2.000691.t1/scaffold41.1/size391900/8
MPALELKAREVEAIPLGLFWLLTKLCSPLCFCQEDTNGLMPLVFNDFPAKLQLEDPDDPPAKRRRRRWNAEWTAYPWAKTRGAQCGEAMGYDVEASWEGNSANWDQPAGATLEELQLRYAELSPTYDHLGVPEALTDLAGPRGFRGTKAGKG